MKAFFLEDPSLNALLAVIEPFSCSLELIKIISSGSGTAATSSGPCPTCAVVSLGASLPSMISAVDFCEIERVRASMQNIIAVKSGQNPIKTG